MVIGLQRSDPFFMLVIDINTRERSGGITQCLGLKVGDRGLHIHLRGRRQVFECAAANFQHVGFEGDFRQIRATLDETIPDDIRTRRFSLVVNPLSQLGQVPLQLAIERSAVLENVFDIGGSPEVFQSGVEHRTNAVA